MSGRSPSKPSAATCGWLTGSSPKESRTGTSWECTGRPDPGAVFNHGRPHPPGGQEASPASPLRADYVLEYRPGLPIAVVEAKREYSFPGQRMQQAKNYAQLLDVPLALSP